MEDAMVAISGSTALVTGGASGIGHLLARRFAAEGATVVIWDLDEERAATAAAALPGGRPHRGYACDVRDRAAVAAAADRVRAEVGIVDIVVNNAGVVSGKHLMELSDEAIETTFGVNVLGLYWVTRAFLGDMIARDHGHVVTIASAAGMIGVAKQTDYAASKHAAIGFDESLRMELRSCAPGVRTTVVCPFYIDTGMFDGVASRWPRLLPILDPDDVVARIASAVRRDRSRLILPPFVRLLPLARILPPRWFDRLADVLGINVSMQDFVGRTAPSDVAEATEGRAAG
jgi:all-trans-retinol dehydrogenase (NAD+)